MSRPESQIGNWSCYKTTEPTPEASQGRAMSYVYIQTEKPCSDNNYYSLYTVGFYDPNGRWEPESDYNSRDEAAKRVAWLNGSKGESQ